MPPVSRTHTNVSSFAKYNPNFFMIWQNLNMKMIPIQIERFRPDTLPSFRQRRVIEAFPSIAGLARTRVLYQATGARCSERRYKLIIRNFKETEVAAADFVATNSTRNI